MPNYLFKNPHTEEVIEVFFFMNDNKQYIDEDGVEWKRVFTKPNAAVQSLSSLDPFKKRDFIDKTGNMKGTVGDMMSLSEEMSQKRAEKHGAEDPVKRNFFNDYKKKVGKKHLADKPKEIKKNGFTIDLD